MTNETFEEELGRGYAYMTNEEVAKDILRRYPGLGKALEKDAKKAKKKKK